MNEERWKKGAKIGATAFVLLFLLVVTIGNASAKQTNTADVSVEEAIMFAASELDFFASTNTLGFDKWQGAKIGEPTTIGDENGKLLSYQFPVVKDGTTVGIIMVWARKNMGVPVYKLKVGPLDYDVQSVTKKAKREAKEQVKDEKARVIDTSLVYYDFPKLGVLVVLKKGDKTSTNVLVDLGGKIIPDEKIKPLSSKIDKQKAKDAIKQWQDVNRQVSNNNGTLKIRSVNQKVLSVPLYSQEKMSWCAPASAKMILDYQGYYYTQSQIADAMGTTDEGTLLWDIPPGIEQVTNNQVDSWNDYAWTWSFVLSEIDNYHPYISNIPGHSRTSRGYKYDTWYVWRKYQYINDPDPFNGGTYWENYYTTIESALTIVHP